jgi:hypothetical protein
MDDFHDDLNTDFSDMDLEQAIAELTSTPSSVEFSRNPSFEDEEEMPNTVGYAPYKCYFN